MPYTSSTGGFAVFIYSFRGSTIKFLSIVLVSIGILVALIAVIPANQSVMGKPEAAKLSYDAATSTQRQAFLGQFNWQVAPQPMQTAQVTIPKDFDTVLSKYNDLQKQQGFNLEKYKNKAVTRYTYIVTNYQGYAGTVIANLLVYDNKVIGGDVCSTDPAGFVHGFNPDVKPLA